MMKIVDSSVFHAWELECSWGEDSVGWDSADDIPVDAVKADSSDTDWFVPPTELERKIALYLRNHGVSTLGPFYGSYQNTKEAEEALSFLPNAVFERWFYKGEMFRKFNGEVVRPIQSDEHLKMLEDELERELDKELKRCQL